MTFSLTLLLAVAMCCGTYAWADRRRAKESDRAHSEWMALADRYSKLQDEHLRLLEEHIESVREIHELRSSRITP